MEFIPSNVMNRWPKKRRLHLPFSLGLRWPYSVGLSNLGTSSPNRIARKQFKDLCRHHYDNSQLCMLKHYAFLFIVKDSFVVRRKLYYLPICASVDKSAYNIESLKFKETFFSSKIIFVYKHKVFIIFSILWWLL